MPATTGNGWPYILPTDNVADYPVTSQALAAFAEGHVPYAICVGSTAMSVGSANNYTKAVTFPPGLFTITPMIVVTKSSSGAGKWIISQRSPTAAGFTMQADTGDGSTGGAVTSVTCYFVAVQWSSTSGPTPGVTLVQDVDLSQEDDPAAMQALLDEIRSGEQLLAAT